MINKYRYSNLNKKSTGGFNPSRFYGYYAFNGDYTDSTSNNNDLAQTINTYPITFENDRFGVPNSAVRFANTGSGGTGASFLSAVIPEYIGAFSYSFWIYVESIVPNFNTVVVFAADNGTRFNSHRGFGNNTLQVRSGLSTYNYGNSLDLVGKWSFMCVRTDAAGVTDVYMGDLVTTPVKTVDAQPLSPSVYNVLMCGLDISQTSPLNARIDDFGIIQEYISEDDVLDLYNYTQ